MASDLKYKNTGEITVGKCVWKTPDILRTVYEIIYIKIIYYMRRNNLDTVDTSVICHEVLAILCEYCKFHPRARIELICFNYCICSLLFFI